MTAEIKNANVAIGDQEHARAMELLKNANAEDTAFHLVVIKGRNEDGLFVSDSVSAGYPGTHGVMRRMIKHYADLFTNAAVVEDE